VIAGWRAADGSVCEGLGSVIVTTSTTVWVVQFSSVMVHSACSIPVLHVGGRWHSSRRCLATDHSAWECGPVPVLEGRPQPAQLHAIMSIRHGDWCPPSHGPTHCTTVNSPSGAVPCTGAGTSVSERSAELQTATAAVHAADSHIFVPHGRWMNSRQAVLSCIYRLQKCLT
jgi:hypothetical protein